MYHSHKCNIVTIQCIILISVSYIVTTMYHSHKCNIVTIILCQKGMPLISGHDCHNWWAYCISLAFYWKLSTAWSCVQWPSHEWLLSFSSEVIYFSSVWYWHIRRRDNRKGLKGKKSKSSYPDPTCFQRLIVWFVHTFQKNWTKYMWPRKQESSYKLVENCHRCHWLDWKS